MLRCGALGAGDLALIGSHTYTRRREARITATSGQPLYQEVAEELRAKIADGSYPVGSALPSTAQLMELYGVSLTVARAAVKELQTEGTAQGRQGKGVFVVQEPPTPRPSAEFLEIRGQIDALRSTLSEAMESFDQRLSDLERAVKSRRKR